MAKGAFPAFTPPGAWGAAPPAPAPFVVPGAFAGPPPPPSSSSSWKAPGARGQSSPRTPTLSNDTLVRVGYRVDPSESSYWVYLIAVRYNIEGEADVFTTYMRMCVPADFAAQRVHGLVVLVTGTHGVGVMPEFDPSPTAENVGADDEQMRLLASGAMAQDGDPDGSYDDFGRTHAPPIAAVSYNNPGYGRTNASSTELGGPETTLADGCPDFEPFSPNNTVGDDFCGPQTRAALDAVVETAYEVLDNLLMSTAGVKLILSSFSNGITAASGWLASTDRTVHALIDCEGPMDSVEQTLATECYSPWGASLDGEPLPTELTMSAWAEGGTRRETNVKTVFNYYWRPPDELVAEMRAAQASGTIEWPIDLPEAGTYQDPVDLLDNAPSFWRDRCSLDYLAARPEGGYIRIQSDPDHVQPDVYANRHAVRAMQAALTAGCSEGQERQDVYFADESYIDAAKHTGEASDPGGSAPLHILSPSWDEDDPTTFPDWPSKISPGRTALRLDIARWALHQTFVSGCA